ncbi:hypothetical protein [Haladaptatus sp. ZSTT2]|uniref:hypothetical protein n=1 Tax=Haladaptatus sp. ZSTT2 TaxID=3120515 RepID=UPI00300EEF15
MTTPKTRRSALKAVATGVLAATAGCLNLEGIEGGKLTVRWADDPPEDATVVAMADERVSEVVILQSTLQRVSAENPQEMVTLNRGQYAEMTDALSEVPRYDGTAAGYYLRRDEQVYRLNYSPFCTSVPGVESRKNGRCVVGSSDSNPEPSLDRL